ncbi:MAG TPA: GntR family transcriptional regulator, partial [Oscillatoriaceae cyanobacterium]
MKLSINRESEIPLHDQLVTQIALLIAAGVIKSGQRLPSVRALAQQLDVHRNTIAAVYNALEQDGVVTIKAGSGVRALEQQTTGAWKEGVALKHLATQFVAEAREHGHGDDALREAFELALRPPRIERLLVVDPHADFHPVYRHELTRSFRMPVETRTLDQLDDAVLTGSLLLTSVYHLAPLRARIGTAPVIVFQVNAAESLLARVKALPDGHTLGLISVSDTLRRMAKEVFAGLRGEKLLLLEAHPQDEAALKALVRLSDVLLVDSPSQLDVRRLSPKPTWDFQLIPDESLRSLAQHLPSEAFVGAHPGAAT